MSVNIEADKFKCWVCDYAGRTIYRLVKRFGTFNDRQTWKGLDQRIDVLEFDTLFEAEEDFENIQVELNLPEEFMTLVKNDSLLARPACQYLRNRGVGDEEILWWKIGFCTSGQYGYRIVVPSFNMDGGINYFIARTYESNWRKYLNPQASKDIVFNELYIDWTKPVVLVEGVFDAIRAGRNAVPILGSTLNEHSRLFQKLVQNDTPVYMALDPDAREKETKIIKKFLTYGLETYKIEVSPYSDIAEMSKEEFADRKQRALPLSPDSLLMYEAMSV